MMNDGVAVSAPLILMALWVLTGASALAQTPAYGMGRTPSAEEIRAWDISIGPSRSEEHTSELQSHSEISYAVFCLKKKK